MNCPTCNFRASEPLLAVERVPVSCAQLFPTQDAAIAGGQCRLEIRLCPECGHLWNAAHDEGLASLYDDDYYCSFASSGQAREYQKALANDLDRLIGLSGQTVVEIGCGDGFFLQSVNALGATAIGFEPSSTYEVAAQRQGVEVFNENFQFDGESRVDRAVDVVVMRHVLEHMASPEQVLASLSDKSFTGGAPKYLLLEVPNGLQLLNNNLYFDFYNDHIHYFNHRSLSRLLCSAGWSPLESMGSKDEFIQMVSVNSNCDREVQPLRRNGRSPTEEEYAGPAAKTFRENYGTWKDQLKGIITAQKREGKSIAVWGAGARGVALLCGLGLDADSFAYIVDSDANKHGRYLPVVHLPIHPVQQLRSEPVDCILVTSYTYFDEIWRELEWFRSSGGKVIKIYPSPELVQ